MVPGLEVKIRRSAKPEINSPEAKKEILFINDTYDKQSWVDVVPFRSTDYLF